MSASTSTRKHNHHNYYTKKSFTREEWRQKVLRDKIVTNEQVFEKLYRSGTVISNSVNNAINIDSLGPATVNSAGDSGAANANPLNNRAGRAGLNTSHSDAYMTIAANEPSIPGLLLNYFVTMGYAGASLEMARELGLVVTDEDAMAFNEVYKIRERAEISRLIRSGNTGAAIEKIIEVFGVDVLEELDDETDARFFGSITRHRSGDLHFKLLLMNLIERIRAHHKAVSEHAESNAIADQNFILDIIKYSQEKLAARAASNPKYMKDMELIMTLLLLPPGYDIRQLPPSIRQLYSVSLRNRIADQVNKRLLDHIYPNIANQRRFPDLICPSRVDHRAVNQTSTRSGPILRTDLQSLSQSGKSERSVVVGASSSGRDPPEPQLLSRTSRGSYWARSVASLRGNETGKLKEKAGGGKGKEGELEQGKAQNNVDADSEVENEEDGNKAANFLGTRDIDANDLLYEANLVQVMKIWSWCENQLHSKGIGVPRVENDV